MPTTQSSEGLVHICDRELLRDKAYVDGIWISSESGETFRVSDPATQNVIATLPDLTASQVVSAAESAHAALASWRTLLPQERSYFLRSWHREIIAASTDLATIVTIEQGKPLSEARGEIAYGASFVEWYAEEAKRLNGEVVMSHLQSRNMSVRREPLGVVACVTPWNFPHAMITRKAAAALAAGCTVLVRPADETPLSALALAELADRAGFPPGVFSVLTGAPQRIVQTLLSNDRVRGLSFTGSTAVGTHLMSHCASSLKRVSMELGGHAPFILFADYDLHAGVKAAMGAKFQTSGQDCLAANRIYVERQNYERFIDVFARHASALKVGNGLNADTEIGPLMHKKAVAKCKEHVVDAISKGARLLTGGKQPTVNSLFFQPTVLADVTDDMTIAKDETFGPVAAISCFDRESDVVNAANSTAYGLAAYVFTNDQSRVCRMTNALRFGMIAVNCVKMTGNPIPFGGMKSSGIGREGGHWGAEEFTELKYVCEAYKAEFPH